MIISKVEQQERSSVYDSIKIKSGEEERLKCFKRQKRGKQQLQFYQEFNNQMIKWQNNICTVQMLTA